MTVGPRVLDSHFRGDDGSTAGMTVGRVGLLTGGGAGRE